MMQKCKLFVELAALLISIPGSSQTGKKATMLQSDLIQTATMLDDIRAVSRALERYTKERLFDDVWKRPDLSPRDRSIVTLAALIARNQTMQMPYYYLNLALDCGVKPSEISEIITHLAFNSGWQNAMSAVVAAKQVFRKRGIGAGQLPRASVELLTSQ
jgi:4-carboxymuconolactone decarboxylase